MGGPAIINGKTYREFDNFNMKFPFNYEGVQWQSVEQLYQSLKFNDLEYREYIRKQRDPHLIYMLGQTRTKEMSEGFPENKVENMYTAMKARILAYDDLQELLLNTGDHPITFPGSDQFWGTQGGAGGENWNGQLLERIRAEL